MPIVEIWDGERGRFTACALGMDQQMPYVERFPFTAGDFLYLSGTDYAWTDARALLALDALAAASPAPFSVSHAFRRVGPLGWSAHGALHGAGVAFDMGRGLPHEEQELLRHRAVATGLFSHIAMAYRRGDCIHGAAVPFPERLQKGDGGPFVFLLQEILQAAGLYLGPLTGWLTPSTGAALRRARRRLGLPDGAGVLRRDWHALLTLTNRRTDAKMGAIKTL